ncbi:MAG: hypothetical protein FJ220_02295 [Kiritimatiellaceae bacterium]|nr:hypothetical protein [Kiritimatiellaceae bacterium]
MKKILLFFVLAASALFAQTNENESVASTNGPVVTAIDGYAARVDSKVITYSEVRESAAPYVQKLMKAYKGRELAERIQATHIDAREALIEDELFKLETKDRGLTLSDKVLEDEINKHIRERFNNDRTLLVKALTARRMTMEEWRTEVSEKLTVRVFYNQEVTRRASVPETSVRAEYDKNLDQYFIPFKVRYQFIMISKGKTAEETAAKKKLAEDTLKKLQAGTPFNELAKAVSEGDLAVTAWRSPDDVHEQLRPALKETPAGQSSDLIETPSEFYIVNIVERREQGYTPFEEVQTKIKNKLLDAEKERLHKALIESIRVKHFIERY